MDLSRRKHLFFDLDGTLLDSKEGITAALQSCLRGLGRPVPAPEELLWAIGLPLDKVCERLLGTEDKAPVQEAIRLYREAYWRSEMSKASLYPGIPAVLASLSRSGKRLYLATHKLEKLAGTVLNQFGLSGLVSGVYGFRDEEPESKAGILARGLKAQEVSAGEAVMIGDRDQDALAARECGAAFVGVTYGYGSPEELRGAGATILCASPSELPAILGAG